MPLYAGCPDFMLTALQNKQNEAMRLVTRRKWEVPGVRLTSTRELLRQCGYLSVRQMAYYHSVATVHKTIVHEQPEYLHKAVTTALTSGVQHDYPTSQRWACSLVRVLITGIPPCFLVSIPVSISRLWYQKSRFQSWYQDSRFESLDSSLDIKTQFSKVSITVSISRLSFKKSQFQSLYQDSNFKILDSSLNIKT